MVFETSEGAMMVLVEALQCQTNLDLNNDKVRVVEARTTAKASRMEKELEKVKYLGKTFRTNHVKQRLKCACKSGAWFTCL